MFYNGETNKVKLKYTIKKICPPFILQPLLVVFRKCRETKYVVDMRLFPNKMKRFCPCCGMRIRSFVVGDYYLNHPEKFDIRRYKNTQQAVLCPVCWSLPRHRILASWFNKHKRFLQSSDILYFAPEKSMELWLNRNKVSCVTADLYREVDLRLDIQNTGLPAESYDIIVCNHVLEHVDDFRMALKEMYRILRYKGSFICSFPMDPRIDTLDEDVSVQSDEERRLRFGQHDHKRVFGMNAEIFLKQAGFKVQRINGESFPNEILPVVGPADYDMNCLFRCVKC